VLEPTSDDEHPVAAASAPRNIAKPEPIIDFITSLLLGSSAES